MGNRMIMISIKGSREKMREKMGCLQFPEHRKIANA